MRITLSDLRVGDTIVHFADGCIQDEAPNGEYLIALRDIDGLHGGSNPMMAMVRGLEVRDVIEGDIIGDYNILEEDWCAYTEDTALPGFRGFMIYNATYDHVKQHNP